MDQGKGLSKYKLQKCILTLSKCAHLGGVQSSERGSKTGDGWVRNGSILFGSEVCMTWVWLPLAVEERGQVEKKEPKCEDLKPEASFDCRH